MTDQAHKLVTVGTGSGTNNNDVVMTIADDSLQYDTWIIGSSAGALDVFVSLDGTNFQSAALALLDLGSATPTTMVAVTTAGGNFAFRGKYKKIRVDQNGATAVVGAVLNAYRTT